MPASVQIVAWPRTGPQRIAVFAPLYRVWWTGFITLVAVDPGSGGVARVCEA